MRFPLLRLSPQEQDFNEARAEQIVTECLAGDELEDADLATLKGSDPRKVAIAARVWSQTTVSQGWIARRLAMGTANNVSQQLRRWRQPQQIENSRSAKPGRVKKAGLSGIID